MDNEEKIVTNIENIALALQGIETQLKRINDWLYEQEKERIQNRISSLADFIGKKKEEHDA